LVKDICLAFRISNLGVSYQNLGFRVYGDEFRVYGLGIRICRLHLWIRALDCRLQGVGAVR
jgi:hypothetical protein